MATNVKNFSNIAEITTGFIVNCSKPEHLAVTFVFLLMCFAVFCRRLTTMENLVCKILSTAVRFCIHMQILVYRDYPQINKDSLHPAD